MPTGQAIGEPKVEVRLDRANRLATVTITDLMPQHRTPHVIVHRGKDGQSSHVEISGVMEHVEPKFAWKFDDNGKPESVVVSNICLERCCDEPGRMSDDDILHHVMHMAALALHDHMDALKAPDALLAKELEEAQKKVERRKTLRPVVAG